MYNIIVLLQIIAVILIFALIMSKERKAIIRIGIPALLFLIGTSMYYSVPRGLKIFSDIDQMSNTYELSIETDRSNIDYVLLDKDADLIYNHLSMTQYTPDHIGSYRVDSSNVVLGLNVDNYKKHYTMIVNLNSGKGMLMSAYDKRDYRFTASNAFIESLKPLEEKYQNTYFDFELDYEVQKTDDGDMMFYTYTFPINESYSIDQVYLYRVHKDNGYGWTTFPEYSQTVSFNLSKTSDDPVIHLVIRGTYNNLPFEKIIDVIGTQG